MWAEDEIDREKIAARARTEPEARHPPSSNRSSDSDRYLCIVCQEYPMTIRLPCGHALLCVNCAKILLQNQQPCPTCRAPFQLYYKMAESTIRKQPSYLDPSKSKRAEFGRVVRMSVPEMAHHLLQLVKRGATAIYQHLSALVFLTIILLVGFLPLGLGTAELAISIPGLATPCNRAISVWLTCAGILHLASFCLSIFTCLFRSRDGQTETTPSSTETLWKRFYRVTMLMLLIIGADFVYSRPTCRSSAYVLAFYLITIGLILVGLLLIGMFASLIVTCVLSIPSPSEAPEQNPVQEQLQQMNELDDVEIFELFTRDNLARQERDQANSQPTNNVTTAGTDAVRIEPAPRAAEIHIDISEGIRNDEIPSQSHAADEMVQTDV